MTSETAMKRLAAAAAVTTVWMSPAVAARAGGPDPAMKQIVKTVLVAVLGAIIATCAALVGSVILGIGPAYADTYSCGDQCNGNVPSYDNPNCLPGAIYCPPAGSPPDLTVIHCPPGAFAFMGPCP